MNAIAKIDAARPQLVAGARPTAIVPTSMDEAYRLANAVCEAGMAPRGLDTPAKAMIAIMQGLEVGLTPMASMQRIAVVNGRPTIWGDAAMGLVRASGLCEWVRERVDGAGDQRVALCEAKRKGEPEAIIGRFSVADAKTAGLWGKSGPWQQYPARMLQMRARAFALRDGFADVLGGMYVREEIEDSAVAARDVTPPSPPSPSENIPSPAAAARLAPPTVTDAPSPPATTAQDSPTFGDILQDILMRIAGASDRDELSAVAREVKAQVEKLPDELRARASKARADRERELTHLPDPTPPTAERHPSLAETNPDAWIAECERRMAECADIEALSELWECVISPESENAFPTDLDEVRKAHKRHEARLGDA